MKKNIKKLIALTVALTSVCSIGNISGFNLFEKAYAISSVVHIGELKELTVKTIEGEELNLLGSFDEDDIVEYDSQDKEYKLILPQDSEGIRISSQVKSDKDREDDNGGKYALRIFTSNKGDAKPYEAGDDIEISDDTTTIYIRTYKSKDKFKDLYYDGNVTNSAETYKIVVKKAGTINEESEDGTNIKDTDIILPKIDTTSVAESVERKNEWVKKGDYWLRYNTSGQALKNAWYKDESNSKYYYLQPNGYMTTGWRFIDGDWYCFNQSGEMMTGWVKTSEGKWFYLMPSGKMARSTTIEGYTLNSKGEYIK
ncbi:MAG: hypothetical protein E7208_00200 [Clostridium butyricum]|nr:hypothetical protein [Clostridium butyricum]